MNDRNDRQRPRPGVPEELVRALADAYARRVSMRDVRRGFELVNRVVTAELIRWEENPDDPPDFVDYPRLKEMLGEGQLALAVAGSILVRLTVSALRVGRDPVTAWRRWCTDTMASLEEAEAQFRAEGLL